VWVKIGENHKAMWVNERTLWTVYKHEGWYFGEIGIIKPVEMRGMNTTSIEVCGHSFPIYRKDGKWFSNIPCRVRQFGPCPTAEFLIAEMAGRGLDSVERKSG